LRVPRADRGDDAARVARGQLPADLDAALATQALHAYMVGIMHEWVLDPAAYDLAAAAPGFIDIFMAGSSRSRRAWRRRKPRRARLPGARASHARNLRKTHDNDSQGRRHRRRHDGQRHRAGVRDAPASAS
jgi:hypothetical protein